MSKPDSERFLELQRASTRDVKAVGMVAASTGLEMIEHIRTLEQTSIPLATVAAALRELLEDLDDTRESLRHSVDCGIAFGIAINKVNSTIAALGLTEETK